MRKNMFGEDYLGEEDSIVDYMSEREISGRGLTAFIDPDDDGVTFVAEILGDSGPLFYVEGYTSDVELEVALYEANIEFVEVAE